MVKLGLILEGYPALLLIHMNMKFQELDRMVLTLLLLGLLSGSVRNAKLPQLLNV